jgi:hypothetical protein
MPYLAPYKRDLWVAYRRYPNIPESEVGYEPLFDVPSWLIEKFSKEEHDMLCSALCCIYQSGHVLGRQEGTEKVRTDIKIALGLEEPPPQKSLFSKDPDP